MDNIMDNSAVKYCKGCATNKNRINDFHHSSAGYCKTYCKPCAKVDRRRYVMNGNYIKRQTGLSKKSPDTQQIIRQMIAQKATLKDISNACNIPYITVLSWNRKGLFNN